MSQHTLAGWVHYSLRLRRKRMKSLTNEQWITAHEGKMHIMHQILQPAIVLKPASWDFQPPEGKKGKRNKIKKEGGCKFIWGGLFFSINNSFCRTGEGVKLDILEECVSSRGWREIMRKYYPKLSPQPSWGRVNKEKLRSCWIRDSSGEITLLLLSSTNIYCKATLRKHLWNALLEHLKKQYKYNNTCWIESKARSAEGIITALTPTGLCFTTLNVRKSSNCNIYTFFFTALRAMRADRSSLVWGRCKG